MSTQLKKWKKLLDNKENSKGFAGIFAVELNSEADVEKLREALIETDFEFRIGLNILLLFENKNFRSAAGWPVHSYIRVKNDQDAMMFKLSVNL